MDKKNTVWVCLTNHFDIPDEFISNQIEIKRTIPTRTQISKTKYSEVKTEKLTRWKM